MLTLIALLAFAAPPSAPPAPKFASAVYASIPAPKFKGEPVKVKATHPDCECETCKCAVCDGGCSPVAASVGGKWVVTLNGRKYIVDGSETKDDAVRLAKKVAGEPSKAVAAPSASTRMVKGHEHKCRSCGTVWAHPDNSSSASHNCPKCGRVQTVQHRDVMVPVAVASKPAPTAPAKPKRVNIGGRWYDQYADGRLVECSA